jgi:hypothetical protein
MRTRPLLAIVIVSSSLAWSMPAEASPVDRCRAAHGGDSAAHISCLEEALRDKADPGGLGAEQVIATKRHRDEADAEPMKVEIVSVTYDAGGLGTFRMHDGQLWRETSAAPARRRLKPGTQYSARIVAGSLGGYRMHVEGVPWMKTVKRLE